MTTPDIELILDRWLGEGTDVLPDRSVEAVLRTVERTSQRRALRAPWRTPTMIGNSRLAVLAGAAVIVVLVVGGMLWVRGSSAPLIGGPTPSATAPGPTSVPSPSAQPSAVVGLTPDVLVGLWVDAPRYELILGPSDARAERSDGTPLQTVLGNIDAVQADVIEFGPSSTCDGPGSYRWTIGVSADPGNLPGSRPGLYLRPVEDSCVARRSFLEGSWEARPFWLAVGRHSVRVDGVRFSFDMPLHDPDSGWAQFGNISISRSIIGPQDAEGIVYWTSVSERGLADPCADVLNLPVSATAADLAAAVAVAPGTELVSGPADVILGGRPAKHVVVTVSQDLGCDPGYFYSWHEAGGGPFWDGTTAGDTISVWIADVDGKRLFIAAATHVDSGVPSHALVGPKFKQEVEDIVDSIQFE